LSELFGGVETDIWSIFLKLPSYDLNGLLARYGAKYGSNAEQYARNTYGSWRSGGTKPSTQTLERLIEFLPPFLTKGQRYELVKKLRQHHLKRENLYLWTTPEHWREELLPLLAQQIEQSKKFQLPQTVYAKAAWLSDGNTEAALQILRAIEEEEARVRLSRLDEEFKRIEFLLRNVENMQPVHHKIVLPQGDVSVTIKNKEKTFLEKISSILVGGNNMDSESNQLVPRSQANTGITKREVPGSLLNASLAQLTEEQRKALAEKAVAEKLGLDVSAEVAEQRHYDSTRSMAQTIQAADALERNTRSDFDIKSSHDTASGRTDIHIKKNSNTAMIVIAVVIGIIIFLFLRR